MEWKDLRTELLLSQEIEIGNSIEIHGNLYVATLIAFAGTWNYKSIYFVFLSPGDVENIISKRIAAWDENTSDNVEFSYNISSHALIIRNTNPRYATPITVYKIW